MDEASSPPNGKDTTAGHTLGPLELCIEDDCTITLRVKDWDEPLMGDYRGCIVATLRSILGRDDSANRNLANAHRFVRVWNSHDALLTALKAEHAVTHWKGSPIGCETDTHETDCPTCTTIREAKGEQR